MLEQTSLVSESKLIDDTQSIKLPNPRPEIEKKAAEFTSKVTSLAKEKIMNFEQIAYKKSLFFRLYITGIIEQAHFDSYFPLKLHYEFVAGPDWGVENGKIASDSQFSSRETDDYDYYVYNQHFEINFRSINPFGWPQLVISVSRMGENNKEEVVGYGCCSVPVETGKFKRKVSMFCATESEGAGGFFTKVFGIKINKTNEISSTPKVISSGQGREISRVNCLGWVEVEFQVGLRNVEKFGLSIK